MLSSATRPDSLMALLRIKPSQGFQRMSYNAATSSPSLPLTLAFPMTPHSENNHELNQKRKRSSSDEMGTKSLSCPLSMACHEIPYGEDDQELFRKCARLHESGIRSNSFTQLRLPALDPKPIAQFDGNQVVKMVSTSKKYDCTTCSKSFSTSRALGGHRSSHYVEENNEGNHVCKVCSKSFPTGRALGGHKRCHYDGVLLLKRKAPPTTISSMPVSQNKCTSKTDNCVKLFGFDLNKAQGDKEINLELTL